MAGESFGTELGSLNFRDMIGGPLVAVVEAQSQAAMATIAFIQSIGFDKDGNAKNVAFKYSNLLPAKTPTDKPQEQDVQLIVPLLALTSPPSLRIEKVVIDFNAKLNSVERKSTSDQLDVGVELDAKGGFGPFSAELKANFAYQRKTEEGSEVNRTYSLSVHVEAVQDELPAGLDRVLNMLESSIKNVPVGDPKDVKALPEKNAA
jgi:hypothetical protein